MHFPEPTICPYGYPYRVFVRSTFANNYHPSKPVIAEVFPSGEDVPSDLELIEAKGDESIDILKPKDIDRSVSFFSFQFLLLCIDLMG